MELKALHGTHDTVRDLIPTRLLHGCVSVFAVTLAGFVVLFGLCVLPFSTYLRHPHRLTGPQLHAVPPRTP